MPARSVLTTLGSDDATLLTADGNPYPVHLLPGPDADAVVSVVEFFGVDNTGAADTTAEQVAAVAALAPGGQTAWYVPGTYRVDGNVRLVSGAILQGSAGAILEVNVTVPFTGAIYAIETFTSPLTGTLHASLTAATSSVQVDGIGAVAPTVGQFLYITHGNTVQLVQIESVTAAGGGAWTLGLFYPLVFGFQAGDPCAFADSTTADVIVNGNGMRASGGGRRALEFYGALRPRVTNLHVDESLGTIADTGMSFDGATRDGIFSGCCIDGTASWGLALESNVHSLGRDCVVTSCPVAGCLVLDSFESGWRATLVQSCGVGFRVGSNGGGLGNIAAHIDGAAVLCTTGVLVESLSVGTDIGPIEMESCATGVTVQAATKTTTVHDATMSGVTAAGISSSGDRLVVRSSTIGLAGGAVGIAVLAGVTSVSDVTMSQAAAATGISVAAGATLRLGHAVNLSTMTTPIAAAAGSFVSRGTVALNGLAAVAVPFPDINAQDVVTLSVAAYAGTGTGLAPAVTVTPGVGFSVTGAVAGDTSTLHWSIGP